MAIGLDLLGRGGRRNRAGPACAHLLGSIIGGALIGTLVGSFGALVLYHSYVAMAVIAAIGLVLTTRGVYKLGRNCQVPRKVGRVTVPWRTYLIWGGMLGSGVATLIPYPVFLLVMGFELTSGTLIGAACGGVYGFSRELPILISLLHATGIHNLNVACSFYVAL